MLLVQAFGGMISYSEENACPPIGEICVGITAVTPNTENDFSSCILRVQTKTE